MSSSRARLLAVMGSGETTPTMSKVHRELFARLGPGDVPAVVMDTPYGFQSNASEISARAKAYFRESTGRHVEIASLARAEGANPLALEAALARVADAQWVFSGPGSPTYALRQWRLTVVPKLLEEKLLYGGCIVFSSAAALTLGRWTVPVYEIYKAGADPRWEEGLDLLAPLGMTVAVIPHYDNAEGGTHDTRYCYLGENRLRAMEDQLPDEGWVLGIDEHTVCIFDLEARNFTVLGLGTVTVRSHGRSVLVEAGRTIRVEELIVLAGEGGGSPSLGGDKVGAPGARARARAGLAGPSATSAGTGGLGGEAANGEAGAQPYTGAAPSLASEAVRLSAAFDAAVARREAAAATEAVLELETTLHAWSADTFQSDELDRARAALRRMVVRLGELAATGLRDPREVVAPWAEALLTERSEARASRRFDDADRIRLRLEEAGVEVRDTAGGTEWDLRAQ